MRDAFINEVTRLAAIDRSIEVLTGDLGFGVWREFEALYPERFTNAGIMEQSMIGIAAGMALCGKKVFVYSIGGFPVMRCLEQIRNDCAFHGANVKIAAVGAGLSYGALGMSHFAAEDIGAMRSLPGVRIYCPADREETLAAVREAWETPGTCYLRLGRTAADVPVPEPSRISEDFHYGIPRKKETEGHTVSAILSTGDILSEALEAAGMLEEDGIDCCVYSIPLLKPFDGSLLERLSEEGISLVVTLEEHQITGGLGSIIAEAVSERGLPVRLLRLGLKDCHPLAAGSRDYLRKEAGISALSVSLAVKKVLSCRKGRKNRC